MHTRQCRRGVATMKTLVQHHNSCVCGSLDTAVRRKAHISTVPCGSKWARILDGAVRKPVELYDRSAKDEFPQHGAAVAAKSGATAHAVTSVCREPWLLVVLVAHRDARAQARGPPCLASLVRTHA